MNLPRVLPRSTAPEPCTAVRRARLSLALVFAAAVTLCPRPASAQWVEESYALSAGWNAIWLTHDCSYTSIDTLLTAQPRVVEVWQWNPLGSTTQFVAAPAAPVATDAEWKVWRRGNPNASTLNTFAGNSAYLVRVTDGNPLTISLIGAPLPPNYAFKSSGLNLIGFSMQTPESTAQRSIDRFLSFSEVLKLNPPVFTYRGGALSDVTPKNPLQVTTPRTTAFARNKAYWVNSKDYTDYGGPLRIQVLGSQLDFGDSLNSVTVRIKNVVDPTKNQTVIATLASAASAAAPTGQPAITGPVPLLVRGAIDPTTQQYSYTSLAAPITRSIAPGEEIEVVLSVDRGGLGNVAGKVFQSLLQISDSLSLTRVDLGVRATSSSFSGVWVGAAILNKVDQIIGQTNSGGQAAPSNFPVRLVMHRAENGTTTLLQQVYLFDANGTPLVSTKESVAHGGTSGKITRLSSASFPLDLMALGTGQLGISGAVNFNVALGFDAVTNPFVHTYHPDHDNLDARFEQQVPAGVESPNITRAITLTFTPSLPGVSDPTVGTSTLGGTYSETITGLRVEPITVSGAFVVRRVSAAQALLTQ